MNKLSAVWFGLFPAMREPNFRLYFFGQLISWSGNWLQMAALGWLVKSELHGTALQIGLISGLPQITAALLSFFAGAITDRFDERPILYMTQGIQMLQAFLLGYLALTHTATFANVAVLAVCEGIVKALDRPTAHTLIRRVSGEHLRSATAMNGTLIMAGASIGGFLASVLIPIIGLKGLFFANGLSFIPIFLMFTRMQLAPIIKPKQDTPLEAIRVGWQYLLTEKRTFCQILLIGIFIMLGFSCVAVFPVIASDMLHATKEAGAEVNSYLNMWFGIGAFAGTVMASALQGVFKREGSLFRMIVIGGQFLVGISLALAATAYSLGISFFLISMAGFGMNVSYPALRGSIQEHVRKDMYGRVIGFLIAVFLAANFVGRIAIGKLADAFGMSQALRINGFVAISLAVILWIFRGWIFVPRKVQSIMVQPIAV